MAKCSLQMSYPYLSCSPGNNILIHFKSRLMWITQTGFLSYWMHLHLPRTNRCSAPISTRSSEKAEKLTMKYLSGAFLILVAGMLISLVVFVLEIIYYQCHQCRLAPSPFARKANEEHLANRQHQSIVI